jgi:hypothetical protein
MLNAFGSIACAVIASHLCHGIPHPGAPLPLDKVVQMQVTAASSDQIRNFTSGEAYQWPSRVETPSLVARSS